MINSLLLSWVVVIATAVRVVCVVDKSGPERTTCKAIGIFIVEIVGSFLGFIG